MKKELIEVIFNGKSMKFETEKELQKYKNKIFKNKNSKNMKAIAVYLCGDELPSAIFPFENSSDKITSLSLAENFPENKERWMDREIKLVKIKSKKLRRWK